MYCKYCGAKLAEHAHYCSECGKKVSEEPLQEEKEEIMTDTFAEETTEDTVEDHADNSETETISGEPETEQKGSRTKKTWEVIKTILVGIIAIVCILAAQGIMADQVQETIEEIARETADDSLEELKDMGISYSLNPLMEEIPKAEKYTWKEASEGGGRVGLAFGMMMMNDDFQDIIKVGKSVKYLNFEYPMQVLLKEGDSEETQYLGEIDVYIAAFYQGHAENGIVYIATAEPDEAIEQYIGDYTDFQEQNLFQECFHLEGSTVDLQDEKITIRYDWTNLRNTAECPGFSIYLSAYQDGYELEQDYFHSETDSLSKLQAGKTGEYSVTYYLRDTYTPVNLVVENIYGEYLIQQNRPSMEFEISISDGQRQIQQNTDIASFADEEDYIFPYSDIEYLQEWELYDLSAQELKIARNEIYARHGRMFQDDSLQAYFNSCNWYTPSIAPEDFKESMLNAVEIANRDLIVSYEKEMGYR